MTFVLFIREEDPDVIFVGASLEGIMDDTKGGKRFGQSTFVRHEEIDVKQARALCPPHLEAGISAANNEEDPCLSWCAGPVRESA